MKMPQRIFASLIPRLATIGSRVHGPRRVESAEPWSRIGQTPEGIAYRAPGPGEKVPRILGRVLVMIALSIVPGCNKRPSGGELSEWLEGELDVEPARQDDRPRAIKGDYYLICKGRAYILLFEPDCAFGNMDDPGGGGYLVPGLGKAVFVHDGARYRAKGFLLGPMFETDGSRPVRGAVHTHDGKKMPVMGLRVTDFELVSSGDTGK
jgi:hypothetical protein